MLTAGAFSNLMNYCTEYVLDVHLNTENKHVFGCLFKVMETDTPRPSILVDDLHVNKRPWPPCKNLSYDAGIQYCFRLGKTKFQLWKWPWPEWIGIPTYHTLDQWFDMIDHWKRTYKGTYNNYHVEKCIRCMLRYL